MIVFNPNQRITIKDALLHPYYNIYNNYLDTFYQ